MAMAQLDQGAINGVVKDSTGAVIAHAQVTLTNTDTNFALKGTTDARGQYNFSPIKIGNYILSATASGFETTTQEDVRVNIQDRLNIDITLKPGGVKETVTVTGAPPMLQQESASVGQVMDTESINNTPLNGRNWVYIAQLSAGVDPGLSAGGARGGGTGDFSANGQRTTQNNFILDGVDNNVNVDDFQNGASYNVQPPPDALAEFKVDTSNYSAEFGHSAGAVVNASIKSGTNQIHGDLWEYVRNNKLNGTDWDSEPNPNDPTGKSLLVPAYHQNQFGATLGLPIVKSKLFYFGDVEDIRIAYAKPYSGLNVPTASQRNGDFSELFDMSKTGRSTPWGIFAPNSAGQLPLTTTGGAVTNPDPACATYSQTCAWNNSTPGVYGSGIGAPTTNVLNPTDPSQVDPVGKALLSAYPLPNSGGWTSSNVNTPDSGDLYSNYSVNSPTHDDTWKWDQRLDWNPSAADQAYARFSYQHEQVGHVPLLGPIIDGNDPGITGGITGAGAVNSDLAENFMISETHIVSPSLINEFRFGYNWGVFSVTQSDANIPAEQLIPGMGGVPFTGYAGPNGGIPYINWGGTDRFTRGGEHDIPSVERQNIYQILDNVTKNIGSHSLKFGAQLESIRASFAQSVFPRGRYSFNGVYTSKRDPGGSGTTNTGMSGADALTDNMSNVGLSPGWNTEYYRDYRSAYVQDDWKVNSKLTANLGVRYDFIQPPSSKGYEVANLIIQSQGLVAPGTGTAGGAATGAATYVLPSQAASAYPLSNSFLQSMSVNNISVAYTSSNPNSLISVQQYNFAPRVGVSYQIDAKTVVRSGYGLFYGSIEAPGGAELQTNYPFAYQVVLYDQYLGTGSCFPSSQYGYSNASSACPSSALADSPATLTSLGVSAANSPFPYGTTLETGMSQYLSHGGIGAFAGSSGIAMADSHIKTTYTESYNLSIEREITRDMVATVSYVGNVGKHTFAGTDPLGPLAITSSNNPTNTSAFPVGIGLSSGSAEQWIGESMYNGLQAKIQQRFANGFSFLGTYTWSHAVDDAGNPGIGGGPPYRNTNLIPLKYEMTNSNFDTRHRLTFNGLYELPFGKGRKYLANSGVLDYLVGGWSASATWTAQTGIPFTVFTGGGNFVAANGIVNGPNAILVGNPFKGGGRVPTANLDTGSSCPLKVKTRTNWYNPCAFIDPQPGTNIGVDQYLTDLASAIEYAGGKSNQIHGPGWERVNMSGFKNFKTFREQYVQFRADAFNLFNSESWGQPSETDLAPSTGLISSPQPFQNNTPDARFFQLSAKYVF
jgi:hypothetical protein